VFVGMPLALMLWPIPELAWIARAAMRMFATVLAIPLAWAVCFATFAAIGVDALALKGAGKAVDALIMPLVAVALLWLVVALPKTMVRMPLCWTHHRAYDTGRLELLPHLEPQWRAEVAHAVSHLGLIGAVWRLAPRRR
jgi:hypothetical protein